ncbi:MAG: polysaccharide biosynthesis protein, partial [Bacteroidia bacterium]|nr:polysaccharide biosynthesis protein [Bacteroidia bacterium]
LIQYLSTSFMLVVYRIIIKTIYLQLKSETREKANIVIIGAGESGIITKRTLDRDVATKYNVIGFIDENTSLQNKKLEGTKIFNPSELPKLIEENNVQFIIIAIPNISAIKKQEVADLCFTHNVKLLNVPPIKSWINGELSFKQIKKIKIEELLERDPIVLDEKSIANYLSDKKILISGAAGSIGSELVRQIIKFNPRQLILVDQAETPLYEIELELSEKFSYFKNIEVIIADITNKKRLLNIFEIHQPQVVFHAAAYKHVPLMEHHPAEAIETNCFGTKNLADLAVQFKTDRFVFVSTDKAVNPTNIMGASKRIAEMYVQSLNNTTNHTRFITTRFGNVLGSNGSVINRFRKQIDQGGPITITHPDIERFFMTIPEACQLVLEAGAMGKGGEIFVFDMGKQVKIIDLAKKMIKLSGLTLGKDIQTVFTGLRPGEKLYEELLSNKENTLPTHHLQILIGKVVTYPFEEVTKEYNTLLEKLQKRDNLEIVSQMKKMIPEFISNNSIFESLDKKINEQA